MNKPPIIKKKVNQNTMWISCKFHRGGKFKFTVFRYGYRIEFDFYKKKNDQSEEQFDIFKEWVKINHTTSYGDLFNKLHELCLKCKTEKDFILTMKNQLK